MTSRITYFKRLGQDMSLWIAEYDENLKLSILKSEDGKQSEKEEQYETLDQLEKAVETEIKELERNGYEIGARQTFVDLENPTVDELEQTLLLRYKLMGITDTYFTQNARKEAMKMLKQDAGEFDDYDLETMEFNVDLKDVESMRNMLEWQIENFDEFVEAVSESMSLDYGQRDDEEGFVRHEDEDGDYQYNSEGMFYNAAAAHPELHPLIEAFIDKVIERNEDGVLFKNEETPFGVWAAFELAMADKKYLSKHIELVDSMEDSARFYYARCNPHHGMHIPKLMLRYGFDKNDDEVIEFLAAQMAMRDNQHLSEEVSMLASLGLEDAMQDPEYAEKMFAAMLRHVKKLSDYYDYDKITEWLCRDLAASLRTLGIKASQSALEEILEDVDDDDDLPTLDDFNEIMADRDDDDDDDDDEDDDDKKKKPSSKKFSSVDFKNASKELGSLDINKVKAVIETGIPLNSSKFSQGTAIDTVLYEVLGNKIDEEAQVNLDNILMLLISNGAKIDIQNFETILYLYLFNLKQTINYIKEKGYDINKTTGYYGDSNILKNYIYMPDVVELLLNNGANPALIPTALHDALRYLPTTLVRRFVEEFHVPLQNENNEGLTPYESIKDFYEDCVEPRIKGYEEDANNPKKKDKPYNSGKTPQEELDNAKRIHDNLLYIQEVVKDLKPLYSPAETPEEQNALDMALMEECGRSLPKKAEVSIKMATIEKLLGAGANPNACDAEGKTALHYIAARYYPGDIEKGLDLLRKAGAKPDILDNMGRTPIFYFYCSYHGDRSALQKLVNFGIDVTVKDKDGYNAIGYVLKETDPEETFTPETVLQSMLQVGVPADDVDPDGNNIYFNLLPLIESFELEDILELVKKQNIDINALNNAGYAPLHFAVMDTQEREWDSYVEKLLEAGADVNVQDAEGNTAIHLTVQPNEDIEVLLKFSPDLSLKNKAGKSALDSIKERGLENLLD